MFIFSQKMSRKMRIYVMNKKKSERYLVGEFNATDANGKLKSSGFVEVESKYATPLLLLLFSPFGDSNHFISFGLDAIKARSLVFNIKKAVKTYESFTFYSGGTQSSKKIKIRAERDHKENGEPTLYLDISESGKSALKFSFALSEAYGYTQELEFLLKECSDATYKMQRFIDRKLKKEAKR